MRCLWVNLDRDHERREAFRDRVARVEDWPFARPERWPGREESAPDWWLTGDAAWSIWRTHLALYADCLSRGTSEVAIFEDDAVFCQDFGRRARELLAAVPGDWEQLYLGGHHHARPTAVSDQVLRPQTCNGTYAYALRGRGLVRPFELLAWAPHALGNDNAHIDTLLAALHKQGFCRAYAPWRWLCGHAAGVSTRTGEESPEQWFFLCEEFLQRLREELRC